jgi:hypothetical protein
MSVQELAVIVSGEYDIGILEFEDQGNVIVCNFTIASRNRLPIYVTCMGYDTL